MYIYDVPYRFVLLTLNFACSITDAYKRNSLHTSFVYKYLTCVEFNATNHSNLTAIDNSEKFNNNEKICVTFQNSEDSLFKQFHFKTCAKIDIFSIQHFSLICYFINNSKNDIMNNLHK